MSRMRLALSSAMLLCRAHTLEQEQSRGGAHHVQDAVSLVQHQQLQGGGVKPWRLIHVLQQPPRRAHQNVHGCTAQSPIFETVNRMISIVQDIHGSFDTRCGVGPEALASCECLAKYT